MIFKIIKMTHFSFEIKSSRVPSRREEIEFAVFFRASYKNPVFFQRMREHFKKHGYDT